jgi:hypothetical protein
MSTETSASIVDAPLTSAVEPAATKEVDAQPSTQLKTDSEAPSEVPAAAAVEEGAPACMMPKEKENANDEAPLKDENSSKEDSVVTEVVKTESPSVDSNEKQQGIKTDPFDSPGLNGLRFISNCQRACIFLHHHKLMEFCFSAAL